MGSPFSVILSKIYTSHYEIDNIVNNKIYNPFIRVYLKYVDGTFILFRDLCRNLKIWSSVLLLSNSLLKLK